MASFCDKFRPNFWRPSTCTNCYRPKATHAAVISHPMQSTQSRSAEVDGKQIGVVKPYAVVDIPEEGRRRHSEPSVLKCRVRHASEGDRESSEHLDTHRVVPFHRRSRSASVAVFNGGRTRQPITPKRKAPPPPVPPRRYKSATVGTADPFRGRATTADPSRGRATTQEPFRGRATTVTDGGVVRRKRTPPQKPPRTLSTFISAADQEALLQQLLSNSHTPQRSGEIDPEGPDSGQFGWNRDHAESMPPGQLHSEILTVLESTLRSVYERSIGRLMCEGGLWSLRWRDLQVVSSVCVCYSGIPLSIEVCIFLHLLSVMEVLMTCLFWVGLP